MHNIRLSASVLIIQAVLTYHIMLLCARVVWTKQHTPWHSNTDDGHTFWCSTEDSVLSAVHKVCSLNVPWMFPGCSLNGLQKSTILLYFMYGRRGPVSPSCSARWLALWKDGPLVLFCTCISILFVLFLVNGRSPRSSGYLLHGSSPFWNCGSLVVRESFGRIVPPDPLFDRGPAYFVGTANRSVASPREIYRYRFECHRTWDLIIRILVSFIVLVALYNNSSS
jgi:hypothetical protein